MIVLYDGPWRVDYGQFYVLSTHQFVDPGEAFRGQANGLCGAASSGALFLVTGLHTGEIHLRVEEHDAEPSLEASWGEVVEASFGPGSEDTMLVSWAGEQSVNLGLEPVDHRVRYAIHDMDADRELDAGSTPGEPQGKYLLQFWPEPTSPDRVRRRTSRAAAYWHSTWGGG